MQQSVEIFGYLPDGRAVERVTLRAGGLSVSVLTWGAILNDLRLGVRPYSLTLGADSLGDYLGAQIYHGPIIGPVVNRISGARAKIGRKVHVFAANQATDICLHSGPTGTHQQLWAISEQSESALHLTLDLPDGLGGFPGNRGINAYFSLHDGAKLRLRITAQSDATTLFNFANHSYWNLDGSDHFLGHSLQIHAKNYLPVNDQVVPLGPISPTLGSEYNFTEPRNLTPAAPAFDTNFCLSNAPENLREVLVLCGKSGVTMRLFTTQTGLQIYDARDAKTPYSALAIEAQDWPDAPNHPAFPQIGFEAEQVYEQITEWHFST